MIALAQTLAIEAQLKAPLMDLKCAELTLAAMEKYAEDVELNQHAPRVLGNLVGNDAHRARLVELGACERLVAAMKKFKNDELVQGFCSGAIQNISFEYAPAQLKFWELGAAELVLDAMKRHVANALVQEYGCRAYVALLAGNDDLVGLFIHLRVLNSSITQV